MNYLTIMTLTFKTITLIQKILKQNKMYLYKDGSDLFTRLCRDLFTTVPLLSPILIDNTSMNI